MGGRALPSQPHFVNPRARVYGPPLMQIHPLITESKPLAELCKRLAKADFVCVDTEFMRESTFWPELCLIQIADDQEAAAIDPMAPGIDLTPLLDLMTKNEDVLKVVHAGGQDLEIVYNLTGTTPHPLFDTQIAAMALGQGEQVGYSNLVDAWLGIQIDKGARFTDWSRRPLEQRQIDYAIADVTHLAAIFPKMLARLKKTGRGAWLDQEMERIADSCAAVLKRSLSLVMLNKPCRNFISHGLPVVAVLSSMRIGTRA